MDALRLEGLALCLADGCGLLLGRLARRIEMRERQSLFCPTLLSIGGHWASKNDYFSQILPL